MLISPELPTSGVHETLLRSSSQKEAFSISVVAKCSAGKFHPIHRRCHSNHPLLPSVLVLLLVLGQDQFSTPYVPLTSFPSGDVGGNQLMSSTFVRR